ncbi:MAG: TatD family hydrolase [Xanthomonadales bacterium]|nr:TatD family hydrolase [Xanthomonadales bacterium]
MLVDSHCHIDAGEFDADRAEVMARARAAGVTAQVIPAITADGFPALRALCAATEGLYPGYGLHPLFMDAHRPGHLDELAGWLERERPVALGECGLDFYIENPDADGQRHYFSAQLDLARQFDLPLILHARRAVEEVTIALRRSGGLRGVVHSFSGSEEQARQLWDMGFLIGIGGPVTWPRARRLRRIVAGMPLEFLLMETDAPDQPLVGRRGERNEPALLSEICEVVAELRGEDFDHVAAVTSANARRLFDF